MKTALRDMTSRLLSWLPDWHGTSTNSNSNSNSNSVNKVNAHSHQRSSFASSRIHKNHSHITAHPETASSSSSASTTVRPQRLRRRDRFRHFLTRPSDWLSVARSLANKRPLAPLGPNGWRIQALKRLPTRSLSRAWGWFHSKPLPYWARAPVYRLWSLLFRCNLDEIGAKRLEDYPSLADFFTRSLKPGVRPLAATPLVSPVDGRVLHFGEVADDLLEQVKGVTYPLGEFLGEIPRQTTRINPANKLYHCIIYLAPGDYHRVHSPANWSIQRARHFTGELFSVAPHMLRMVKSLFVLNERVALCGSWPHGYFSMTAVGAFNVGSISVKFDPEIVTNHSSHSKSDVYLRTYNSQGVSKGDELATFNLGSTVVLVFEAPAVKFCVEAGTHIRMGEPLGVFTH